MGRSMAGPKKRVETAETEAAAWHARLGERTVATQTIRDFGAWRQSPQNADAYRRVELAWGESRKRAGDPAMQEALDDILTRTARTRTVAPDRRMLFGVAAVSAAALLAFGGWSWMQSRTVFATAVGEQRLVQLADGSSVRLDTGSRIKIAFDGRRRLVDLQAGQALFTVAHDPGKPFVVEAGSARVTAIGTVFEVRRQGADAKVTLVSGVVEVDAGPARQRMQAGHQARTTATGLVAAPVDIAAETSWTEGRIIFRDTPLRTAVAEVNRYLTAKIELDADDLAAAPVNGVFKTGDRDAFVSTAAEVFGLRVSAGADGSVRLSERGK